MSKTEIRRIRESQNLLSRELATRLGVSPARISVLERDEQAGAVTLKMMARAAAALGCEFVYELVPYEKKSSPGSLAAATVKPRLKLQSEDSAQRLDSRMRALLENQGRKD
jgi:transcriptional regulator with XRE-family HTH domain